MAAVIAAIGAAFLAGAIALFREHRLQQRHLLIAARVMHATFGVAAQSIKTSIDGNEWALFNAVPGETSFSAAWETYKGDLAGHLTWKEWRKVESVVSAYLALMAMTQESPPQEEPKDVLSTVRAGLVVGQGVLRPYCTARLSTWRLLRRRLRRQRDQAH